MDSHADNAAASMNTPQDTHELVKNAYGEVARKRTCCCGPATSSSSCCDSSQYVVPDHPVPESELGLSCGDPLAAVALAVAAMRGACSAGCCITSILPLDSRL